MRSAVGEAFCPKWEGGLYLWAPGPRSLGSRDGSPSDSVSDLGSLGNFDCGGYNIDGAKRELMIRSPEAADIRAMVRDGKWEKSKTVSGEVMRLRWGGRGHGRRIVSSGRPGLIPGTLRDALYEEIRRGLCESFQLPVETSRRVWKLGEEVETRATGCMYGLRALGTSEFGRDRA